MSGGGKKKPTRTQGWEEAGSEFYQESYPGDGEFEAIQKDPKHLATLLPSKQNRAAAATIRFRTNDNNKTMRRTTTRSRRESTVHRRASTTAEFQVSMLPDLTDNISNEQTTWEEVMQIKAMPVSMSQKKEMKAKMMNEPNLRLQGYEQLNWKRRKMWRQFQSRLKESIAKLELFKGTLKRIEGYFGTGVVAYFLFLKYLLFLNLFMSVMFLLFIIVPTLVSQEAQMNTTSQFNFLDIIQGTGFMNHTILFYGFYPNVTLDFTPSSGSPLLYYNLPLAYIAITLVCFGVSLVSITRSAAGDFRERLVEGEGQFYQYCNLVFGGWDFCINNEKSANIKHKALYNEIRGCLEVERIRDIKHNRTRNQKIKLIVVRVVVNIVVVAVLAGCGAAIYYIFDVSNKNSSREVYFEQLFYQFLPAMSIVFLNIAVPFLFHYLVTFEHYSPLFVIRLTLARTILLRLASIFTLCASLFQEIDRESCWETFVGQQIYKLVITDFATHVVLTFFVNFPRALLARHCQHKFVKAIGEQSFDLPKHVLDVVYSQTLCWLGSFYAPLLSTIFTVIVFLMFLIKRFACLTNSNPSSTIYRASRSKSMFMVVLMVSFGAAIAPWSFAISDLEPSRECGPFAHLPSVWHQVTETFNIAPSWVQDVVFFLSTAGFAIPVLIVMFLLLYYYRAVNSANRHMVVVLKHQLVLEGHDKQFLLERLSKFIKHQESQRRMRQVEVGHDGDSN